jgi:hypothetical protein
VALDEPLAHWTSLRVGCPEDALVRVNGQWLIKNRNVAPQ